MEPDETGSQAKGSHGTGEADITALCFFLPEDFLEVQTAKNNTETWIWIWIHEIQLEFNFIQNSESILINNHA